MAPPMAWVSADIKDNDSAKVIIPLRIPPMAWVSADNRDSDAEATIEPSAWLTAEDRLTAADSVTKNAPPACRTGDSAPPMVMIAPRIPPIDWFSADTKNSAAEETIEPSAWLTAEDRLTAADSVAKKSPPTCPRPRIVESDSDRITIPLTVPPSPWFRPEASDTDALSKAVNPLKVAERAGARAKVRDWITTPKSWFSEAARDMVYETELDKS